MTAVVDYSRCAIQPGCERRVFWATQIDACAPEDACGTPCATLGLKFIDSVAGRNISTANWVEGLALNIIGTNARRDDTDCGYLPGRLGGHWSEAFISASTGRVGTRIRNIDFQGTMQQQTRDAEACAEFDLQKLVAYGVASSVTCTGTYKGSGVVGIVAKIIGPTAELGRIGFNGARVAEAWV